MERIKRKKQTDTPSDRLFQNLCTLVFRNGIPSTKEAQTIFEATPRTIRNWLNGHRPSPKLAVAALRNYLLHHQWSEVTIADFQDSYEGEKCIARLRKNISIVDRDKILALIYQHMDHLEKCIFFARQAVLK